MLNELTGWKTVSVDTLRRLLADLPGEARIGCNTVNNLLVTTPDEQSLLGYVDLCDEHFEPYPVGREN
jgi:hypothetical protein